MYNNTRYRKKNIHLLKNKHILYNHTSHKSQKLVKDANMADPLMSDFLFIFLFFYKSKSLYWLYQKWTKSQCSPTEGLNKAGLVRFFICSSHMTCVTWQQCECPEPILNTQSPCKENHYCEATRLSGAQQIIYIEDNRVHEPTTNWRKLRQMKALFVITKN